jgi:hypothetical protein
MGEIAYFFQKIAINRLLNFKNPLLRQNVTNIFIQFFRLIAYPVGSLPPYELES